MNSAQLYSELLNCGERLLSALATEREINAFSPEDLSCLNWQDRLQIARRNVESAAEYYAIALRAFRLAMLSELTPSDKITRPRETVRRASAACRNGRGRAKSVKPQRINTERVHWRRLHSDV